MANSKFQGADVKQVGDVPSPDQLPHTTQIYDPTNDKTVGQGIDDLDYGGTTLDTVLFGGELLPIHYLANPLSGITSTQRIMFSGGSYGPCTITPDDKYIILVNGTDLEIHVGLRLLQNNYTLLPKLRQKITYFAAPTDVVCMSVSPDCQYLAIGLSVAPYFKLFKIKDLINADYGDVVSEVSVTNSPTLGKINSLAWSHDNQILAAAHEGSRGLAIYRREYTIGQPIGFRDTNYTGASGDINVTVNDGQGKCVAFSYDNLAIAVGTLDGFIHIITPTTSIPLADSYFSLAPISVSHTASGVVAALSWSPAAFGVNDIANTPYPRMKRLAYMDDAGMTVLNIDFNSLAITTHIAPELVTGPYATAHLSYEKSSTENRDYLLFSKDDNPRFKHRLTGVGNTVGGFGTVGSNILSLVTSASGRYEIYSTSLAVYYRVSDYFIDTSGKSAKIMNYFKNKK